MRYKSVWKQGLMLFVVAAALGAAGKETLTANAAAMNDNGEFITEAEEPVAEWDEEPLVGAYVGSNAHNQEYTNYGRYARKILSYLIPGENGLTRVEFVDGRILVQGFDENLNLLSTQTVPGELSYFGGFYAGRDAYFVVYGQSNTEEDVSKEVIRVVKYSKDWERLGSASLYGANTTVPFSASGLRMCESGDYLFIRTGHKMYADSNGVNHQANLSIMVDTSAMEIEDSFYGVWNVGGGYVSHSFNQFIQVSGDKVYAVDHGDAHLRSIVIGQYNGLKVSGRYSYIELLEIQDAVNLHYNDTGVAVGGFEISDTHCLVAGCSVAQDEDWENHTVRNIWLGKVPVDNFTSQAAELTWITDYQEGEDISVTNPQLVKIDSDNYVLLWEVTHEESFTNYSYSYRDKVQMVTLDGEGNVTGEITEFDGQLSDCQPVRVGDRLIWYVTGSNAEPGFYVFDIVYDGTKASLKLNQITINGVTLDTVSATIYKGETKRLTATTMPSFATDDIPVTWSSADTSVATVKDGMVTAVAPGTTTITAHAGSYTAECTVTVPVVPITWVNMIAEGGTNVMLGKTLTLTGSYYPQNTTDDTTFYWSSSDPLIATVKDGVVTALTAGTTTITLQIGTQTAKKTITVYENPITLAYMSNSDVQMEKGEDYTLTVSYYPQNTTDDTTVTWSSSDTSVVTVENGVLKAVGEGTATITAKIASKSCTCNVVVVKTVKGFVTRMYEVTLDRTPDESGLATWTNGLLNHTFTGQDIAKGFIMSKELTEKGLDNGAYVDVLYRAFFDRAADAAGKQTWVDLLNAGKSREYVLAGFVNSDEFDALCNGYGIIRGTMTVNNENEAPAGEGINGFVERLYSKVLGRTSDAEGINTWVNLIAGGGMSAEDVSKSFFFSDEYKVKNTGDEEFVDTLYQTFMNRAADANGKAFWLSYLAGGAGRTEVLEGFSRSVEFSEILRSYGL